MYNDHTPAIIAHRGASFDAPENTLAAIELAWQQGADAVEIDVRLSKDDRVVAIHDADTARTSDRPLVVAETDFGTLSRIDVGRWKDPVYQGARIPQLAEILTTLPDEGQLLIELKCGEEIQTPLCRELAQWESLQHKLVIIGFNAPLVSQVKAALPAVSALLCVRGPSPPERRWSEAVAEQLIDEAHRLRLDGVDLNAAVPIDPAAVQRLHAAELSCYFWTVDEPSEARALAQCGVDGLTTNRPGWLQKQLTEPNDPTRPQSP